GEPGNDTWFEPLGKPELMGVLARDFAKEEPARVRIGQQPRVRRNSGAVNGDIRRIRGEPGFTRRFGARRSVADVEADRDAGAGQDHNGGDPAGAVSTARLRRPDY